MKLGIPDPGLEVEQAGDLMRFDLAKIDDLKRHRLPFSTREHSRSLRLLSLGPEVLRWNPRVKLLP